MDSLFKIIIGFVGGLAAAALGFYADWLDIRNKDRTLDLEIVKFAFNIYDNSPQETGPNFRKWACGTINALAERSITTEKLDCADSAVIDATVRAPNSTSGVQMRVEQGDANRTDIDIFWCREDDLTQTIAAEAYESIISLGFGRVRLKGWTLTSEYSVADLSGYTSIILDAGHPERGEMGLIGGALSTIPDLPEVRVLENLGAASPWLVSIVVCPRES